MPRPASTSRRESSRTVASGGGEQQISVRVREVADRAVRAQQRPRGVLVARPQPVAWLGARVQVGERALVDDPAGADDRDARAQLLHFGEQVAGQEDGHPACRVLDRIAHVADAARVEAVRRLVQHEQLGSRRSEAARPSRCRMPCGRRRPCRPRGPAARRSPAPARRARPRRRRRRPRAARGSCARSGTDRSAASRRNRRRRRAPPAARAAGRAEQADLAGVRPEQPEHHAHRRRLAPPFGPRNP